MRQRYYYAALLLIILGGCCRENADDCDPPGEVYVKVDIDWAGISPQPEDMKLVFFPTDGSLSFFHYIDHSGQVIQVPAGEYRMLFYNWISTGDVQRIGFTGDDSFTAMEAYTGFRSMATFTEEVLIQPDSLYAWSSGLEPVVIIKSSGMLILQTKPVSLVRQYDFFIPVEGLQYVRGAEAVVSGAARDVHLYNGQVFGPGDLISVSVTRATGGVRCHFSAFGFVGKNIFDLRLTLIDGSTMDVEVDLTDELASESIADFTTVVEVPYTAAGGGGFTDPRFEEWDDKYDEIPI